MDEKQLDMIAESEPSSLLTGVFGTCDSIFVKKLSVNDRDWAWDKDKHQAGVYIPPVDRDSGFFPPLTTKPRDQGFAEIREAFFETVWPQVSETKLTRLVHYTSKGPETHLTTLPKAVFAGLAPASFLVIGKRDKTYNCITVDSESDDCDYLTEILSLPPDFRSGTFVIADVKKKRLQSSVSFIDEVVNALSDGTIAALYAKYSTLPKTDELAARARAKYMADNGLADMNPFSMDRPGDAVRIISRAVEYEIFKDLQFRGKVIELIRLIVGDNPTTTSPEKIVKAIILEFPRIDAMLLSASQQRKSRAGYSFEHHIERMLSDGKIPFDKQVVIDTKKRPDFILPAFDIYKDPARTDKKEALVLSAKTTLRERWKQVHAEIKNCDLFLATVDENIASNTIEDMATQGIWLVVPESLKVSDTTEYKKQSNVIDFRTFFSREIKTVRWPLWIARKIVSA